MEFVSVNEIILADVQGKFTFVKNIEKEEKTTITIINTKISRFRDLKCLPRSQTLITASTEGKLCFYDINTLRAFHLEVGNAKPTKSIKSKARFLCLSINHVKKEQEVKKVQKKKKKAIGKRGKDEKKILKIQKKLK